MKKLGYATMLSSPLKKLYGALAIVVVLTLFKIELSRTLQHSSIIIGSSSLIELDALGSKLRDSVTFLPLKDVRFADDPMKGHTWFMSSLNDTQEEGESQYQMFPSKESNYRVLCLKGRNTNDGSLNSYALAWPRYLPRNAVLLEGTTFISNNHYIYENMWHGLSNLFPFVGWHIKTGCRLPDRWILFHKGVLRNSVAPWLKLVMEATFDGHFHLDGFDTNIVHDNMNYDSICFEEAIVMRRNEGNLSKEKRRRAFDLMRCKARKFCRVESKKGHNFDIGMTLLLRDGPRSFKNSSAVISIFQNACHKVDGCRLEVAHSNNITFCDQVKLLSRTDMLVTPHGAQLATQFLMDRNSSIMELYPKGWKEYAGIGQYVLQWEADWAGMVHQGVWRDPVADDCSPLQKDYEDCVKKNFKDRKIGHNESYFLEWAGKVLDDVRRRKSMQIDGASAAGVSGLCGCVL